MKRSEYSLAMTSVRGIGALPARVERVQGPLATQDLFSKLSLPIDIIKDADRMVPLNSLFALYETAARMTEDPLFGLRTGQEMADGFGDWVEYSIRAPSLRASLERAMETLRYHQSGAAFTLTTNGPLSRYAYCIQGTPPADRLQHFLHTVPAFLRTFRIYSGTDWKPDRIELSVDAHPSLAGLEETLSIPVLTGQPEMAFVFQTAILDRPPCSGTPGQNDMDQCDLETLVQGRPPTSFEDIVREIIHLELHSGAPLIENVADRLNLRPRTLQRKLKGTDRSYRDLVSEIRVERCRKLLAGTDVPVTEIASRLGYSDPAHLTRAFARQMGIPPSEYRNRR